MAQVGQRLDQMQEEMVHVELDIRALYDCPGLDVGFVTYSLSFCD